MTFNIFIKQFSKNKGALIGLLIVALACALALLSPIIAPHPPHEIFGNAFRLPPFFSEGAHDHFFLGTDDVGRDTLSRLLYGARVSLFVGFLVVTLSASVGTFLGLLAGYFGGRVDWFIMRIVDMLMAFPSILLAIVVVSIMGPGLINTIFAVAIVACPQFIRIVRASVQSEVKKEYVLAARSFGATHLRLMVKEILPNCMAPLIVQISLGFSDGILNAAALGFLGLGAQPPTPEWGTMLADARAFIVSDPWLVTLPGLCILAIVLGFNLLGDGLRDALDPKLQRH